MASDTLVEQAKASQDTAVAVGDRRRVGGIGQTYRIVKLTDHDTVHIHTEGTDEELPYPIADAALDPLATEPIQPDRARYEKLVAQYRTIGPDGPTYQVVSITDDTSAKIWIIPNDEDDLYMIENILLDPMHRD